MGFQEEVCVTNGSPSRRRETATRPSLGALSPDYFLVAMADGSTRTVFKKRPSEATLRAAITRNGGDVPGKDW
jgi:hypothetical protein